MPDEQAYLGAPEEVVSVGDGGWRARAAGPMNEPLRLLPACSSTRSTISAGTKLDTWDDIKAWRKPRREALIQQRMQQELTERQQRSALILTQLIATLKEMPKAVLGIYWPFQGEIDVRDVAHQHIANGGIVALPVVVQKAVARGVSALAAGSVDGSRDVQHPDSRADPPNR